METLDRFVAEDKGISDLAGLEFATNLQFLNVSHNSISNLSPLAGLSNLERFDSWGNPLFDLSPLVKLETIDICGGEPDISTLEGSKNLKELYLNFSGVSDVSSIAKLTGLTRLRLLGNGISDISPLAKLTNLKWLELPKKQNIGRVAPCPIKAVDMVARWRKYDI